MSVGCKSLIVKELAWKKKYKKYHDDILEYEMYAQRSFALYNAIVFLIYGIIIFWWNSYIVNARIEGSIICFGVCAFSLAHYVMCKVYLEKTLKASTIATNIYILVLAKVLLSINLVWNNGNGGNISWALLVCSIITTGTICIVPDHYVPTIAVVIVLDTIEAAISCPTFTMVFDNLVDSLIIAAFCIGTNIIFSKHQYAEFDRKEELKFESSRDLLTQLYNRRHIERYYALNAETDRACAMMMLDLDNFKMANDIYGHKKGDEVLCRVADILRGSFRDSDCVARLGGDEFAVFLPGISVNATVERVRSVLESFPITIEGACRVDVSVSIGIAYKEAGEEIDYKTLCDKADEAMYRAKLLGKGKAVVGAEKNTKEVIIVA